MRPLKHINIQIILTRLETMGCETCQFTSFLGDPLPIFLIVNPVSTLISCDYPIILIVKPVSTLRSLGLSFHLDCQTC